MHCAGKVHPSQGESQDELPTRDESALPADGECDGGGFGHCLTLNRCVPIAPAGWRDGVRRMTPDEMLAAAEAGTLNIDDSDESNPQPAEAQSGQQDAAPDVAAPVEQDEQPAPIASKSGTYTIPFEKLAQAREQVKHFAAENEQLKAQIAQLSAAQSANLAQAQAQAQDRADAGQAATQQDANLAAAQQAVADGIDPALFGDFSEEGIAKGVKTLVQQGVQQAIAPILQERQAIAQQTAAEKHYGEIYAAHPDADELVQSEQFKRWMDGLPGFARAAVDSTLATGKATDVVEVFSAFKANAGIKPAAGNAPSKVQQAIAKAQAAPLVPTSLSEMAGNASNPNLAEQFSGLDGGNMLARMENLTPAQIQKLMDSV